MTSSGDLSEMSPELRYSLEALLTGPGARIKQHKDLAKMFLGWDSGNRYDISDFDGRHVLSAQEQGSGFLAALARNFWPFRKIRVEFTTNTNLVAMTFERPWTWFFARLNVEAWNGRPLGYLQQRFRWFTRGFDVCTPDGRVIAEIEGPFFKPWTFLIKQRGAEVGAIRKRWGGMLKEMFTDADSFGVEFGPALTDATLRQLLLAATILIDLVYFEQKKGSSSGAGLLSE